jgi:phage-related protein
MGKSYFIWNGKDCRSMGITLEGPAPIVRGEERVSHVTIPGRAGELTQTEGDCIYQSYIQTVTIQVRGGYRVREIQNWLKGPGEITFSGEPDRKQKARVIGAVTLEKHSRNMDCWVGEVQFYCDPLKEKLIAGTSTITSSGSTVRNNGDTMSRPKITMTASSTSATIVSGGKSLTITGLTSSSVYVIDSEAEIVTDANGTTNLTANSSGRFPVLNVGNNEVTGSGWSQLIIDRKERFL